jgi:hypothetical protein
LECDGLANNNNTHGLAWHWKQTDCRYYTLPGSKKQISLFDDQGNCIRGSDNRDFVEHAPASIKLSGEINGPVAVVKPELNVARVCSEYLQYYERSVVLFVIKTRLTRYRLP